MSNQLPSIGSSLKKMQSFIGSIAVLLVFLQGLTAADDKDVERTKTLIAMIQSTQKIDHAHEILSQIPVESPCRIVAAQAATLVQIQQEHFPQAWTCLQSNPQTKPATLSLRQSEQRLKLWLLLEAGSTKETEAIFKNLVKLTISDAIENSEKASLFEQLGAMIGMLQLDDQSKVIPTETLQQAKDALETRGSKPHVARFREKLEKSNQRGTALIAQISKLRSLSLDEAKAAVVALEAELETAKKYVASTKSRKDEEGNTVDDLEKSRKQYIALRNDLQSEWKKETSGKPPIPIRPSVPRRPKTTFKTDRKTGQRVVDKEPSNSEIRKYEIDVRNYEAKSRQYEMDLAAFPSKLQAWEAMDRERRALLQMQIQNVSGTISMKEKEIEEAKRQMQEGVFAEHKAAVSILHTLNDQVIVSQFALADKLDPMAQSKSSFRPSRFALIDFAYEESRLTKALRQIHP